MELVGQAEREGVSLGVMISREMSVEEIEAAQLDLAEAMKSNFANISHFMAGVEVPSLEELMGRGDPPPEPTVSASSDEAMT